LRTLRADGDGLPSAALDAVRAALEAGEILIYPTDTLYAIGGLALSVPAATRVREAKGREPGKALPLVAADLGQVSLVCAEMPPAAVRLGEAFWPGPLTLVLRAAAGVPEEVTAGAGTVAVRVPGAALTRRLCGLAGPLVSTSANRAGEAPGLTFAEAIAAVGAGVSCAIDGGPGRPAPSTIVDVTGDSPRLLREGAVAWDAVRQILGVR
jgi:tRNA threonylcarbamoyl adenosine modification protein (Sua5/YciO/YrdC/YwlC family)